MALFGGEESLSIVVKLRDEASKQLDDLQGKFKSFNSSMQPAIDASNTFAFALTAVATASAGLAGMAIKSAGDMEALTKGMIAVSGSAEKAQENITRLKEVAKLPGLGFREAIQGSINLQAAGLSASTSERALKSFGNALATVGKGRAELDGVVLALQQISSKGVVSAEEINQLNERLPQIRQAMQAAFGTADTEVLKKMGIRSDIFIEQIIQQFEKLPPVANSFNNSVENLKDAWDQFLMNQGAKLLTWAQQFIDAASFIVSDVLPKWIARAEELGTWLGNHKVILAGLVGVIVGGLTMAVYGLVVAFATLMATLAPFMIAGGALFMLIEGIREGDILMTAISAGILTLFVPSLIALGTTLWTTVIPAFAALAIEFAPFILGGLVVAGVVAGIMWIIKNWDFLVSEAKITMAAIGILWGDMWAGFNSTITSIWDSIKNTISSSVNWVIDKVNMMLNAINSVSSAGASLFGLSNKSIALPNIPKLAEGGVVSSPTIAMIGEAGPEAVVPLSKMGSMGGGMTVVINNPSFNNRDDEERMRRMLDTYFRPLVLNNKL